MKRKVLAAIRDLFTTTDSEIAHQARVREWQEILWREGRHCRDEAYRRQLERMTADTPVTLTLNWQGRPLAMEVEAALEEACRVWPKAQVIWRDPLRRLAESRRQPDRPDRLIAQLSHDDWVHRFVARQTLVALGGETAPALAALAADPQSSLQATATWLLRSIEADTMARLSARINYLLCPRCLVYCQTRLVSPSTWTPYVYCGCRNCGQSRDVVEWTGQIIAVLDAGWSDPDSRQAGLWRGNWLARRSLFDFDRVEIVQATDEAVERFAIQVGNDTDSLRRSRYKEMQCLVGADCSLSENTWRILRRTFGQVERGK